MINLEAVIYWSGEDTRIDSAETNVKPIAYSSDISSVVNKSVEGKNPFVFGKSIIGTGRKFSSGVDYYVGSIVSNQNKEFSDPYKITISGKGISNFIIEFDKVLGRYPPQFSVTVASGKITVTPKGATVLVEGLSKKASSHVITISKWNEPNAPLVVQGIYVLPPYKINQKNMLSCDVSIADRASFDVPSFGLVSNSGSISFRDFDAKIANYFNRGFIKENIKTVVYLTNTLTRKTKKCATMFASNFDYDADTKTVDITIKDGLEELQEIQSNNPFGGYGGFYAGRRYRSLLILYTKLKEKTSDFIDFCELDEKTEKFYSSYEVAYTPWLEGNLWSLWTSFCEVSQSHHAGNQSVSQEPEPQ
jgi:hypothetical protein